MKPYPIFRRKRKETIRKIVDFRNIVYCQAEGNYTRIYFEKGSCVESKILKNFESGLPAGLFFRIHRSILINTLCIVSISDNSVTLKTHIELRIARRRKQDLLKILSRNNLIVK